MPPFVSCYIAEVKQHGGLIWKLASAIMKLKVDCGCHFLDILESYGAQWRCP